MRRTVPLKRTARIVAGQSPPSGSVSDLDGSELPFLQGNTEFGQLHPLPRLQCDLAPKNAERGDVLLSVRAPVGALNVADCRYGIGRGLCAIRPGRDLHQRFAWWMVVAMAPRLSAVATGSTYDAVSADDVATLPVHLPPPAVQRAVADYLDRETARIDALIAAKRRMVELLEERWLGTIHEATRGAWTPGPRRDTEVGWLGSVPSAWRVMAIKRLARVRRGASPRPIDDPVYFDSAGEFAWVRIADVSASDTYLEQTTQRLSPLGSSLSVKMMPGDLILSIAGTVGKPIITRIKCCIHDGFVYFIGLKLNRKYLYYLFTAGRLYLGLGKMGTQLNLNTDTVGSIRIPVPPPTEQEAIVGQLDRAGDRFAALREAVIAQTALLQEGRQALITVAVTGQLDIPSAA